MCREAHALMRVLARDPPQAGDIPGELLRDLPVVAYIWKCVASESCRGWFKNNSKVCLLDACVVCVGSVCLCGFVWVALFSDK